MPLPPRSLFNPGAEQLDLAWAELPAGTGRRHALLRVGGGDALEQLTLGQVARHEGLPAVPRGESPFCRVEAEVGLALGLVGAVAGETVVRQDGPDVAVEFHRGRLRFGS